MAYSAVRRKSQDFGHPDMRIVLLGKSVSENSGVGNFLLGRAAFDSEAPPDVVERVGGRLKDRHVMVINSPQLLQTHISDHQITQTVRECVYLSDPGPHAFILVLKHKDFTEEDMRRVKHVLKKFSEEAIKRSTVLTTDEVPVKVNEFIQQLTSECGGAHLQLDNEINRLISGVTQRLEEILRENAEECLTCDVFDDAEGSSADEEQSRSAASLRTEEEEDSNDGEQHQDTHTQKNKIKDFLHRIPFIKSYRNVSRKQNLNLVLCGSDESLKTSASKLIRGTKKNLQISLVELPALSQLSEEEVMRQTLRCVSLCDPGVHFFLLIIPDGSLTDEHKAEMKEVQKIFSSRNKNHLMILIIKEKHIISNLSIFHTSVTQTFKGQCFVLESSSQVPALLQDVEKMVQQNNRSCYTTLMCLQDRIELERIKHKAEMEELRTNLTKTHSTADDDLRIVLLGKTGVGKSATGNTILRRDTFLSKLDPSSVTRECQKEYTEFNRRQITVIDTPGLFDTGVDNVESKKEIVKCVSMAAPGPHVFLLVIQLGRFTQEEKDTVKMIQETFGEKSRMYTMVLFTRGDDLGKTKIEDYVERNDSLRNLTQQCRHRYHVFNNTEKEDQTQVSELLDKIDCMVAGNGGSFYTNDMFQQVEKNIKEEQERILKEKEKETKKKEEELRDKYEAEIEKIKKENESDIQELQNELRKTEEEFKNREDEIKKETDENLRKEMQRKLEEQKKQNEEENERKEKSLAEQQLNFIKHLEEKHEKDKQKLQEKIQCETREQAEREFREKLIKALEEADAKLPNRSKLSRDWSLYVPVLGGAAGGAVGGVEDFVQYICKILSNRQAQNQTEG